MRSPQLHLIIETEGPVRPCLVTWGKGEGLRLLYDLERRGRDNVVRELADAYGEALGLLQRRADESAPGEVGFTTGEGQ